MADCSYDLAKFCFFSKPQWTWREAKELYTVGELTNRVKLYLKSGESETFLELPTEFFKLYTDVMKPDRISEGILKVVQEGSRWYFYFSYRRDTVDYLDIPLWYWSPSNLPGWVGTDKR